MWLVYPTILPDLVKRGTDDLENATIRLVPAFYTLFLPTQILLGVGQDGNKQESRGRRIRDLLGNSDHPWSEVYGVCVGVDRSGIPPIKI